METSRTLQPYYTAHPSPFEAKIPTQDLEPASKLRAPSQRETRSQTPPKQPPRNSKQH
jgi:hypothetical protein